MNITSNLNDAQHLDSNGAGDSHGFGRVWGNALDQPFDNPTGWLDSLSGGLADYRDQQRQRGDTDETIAERVERLEDEASTLQFRVKPEGTSGAFNVAAIVTSDAGEEHTLHVDRFTLSSAEKRMQFAIQLACSHPAITTDAAAEKLMLLAAQPPTADAAAQKPAEPSSEFLLQQMPQEIREEAKAALEDPELLHRIIADVQAIGVAGEADLIAQLYLTGTSRLLPEPVKCIVSSASSTGKTLVINKVASCFPPEQVLNVNSITANALYYYGLDDAAGLKHKLLVQGERKKAQTDDQADATAAIRQLLSDGRISKLFTDTSCKPPTARHVVIEGPVAYLETTTSTAEEIFNEDLNRALLVAADEQPDQTKRVIKFIAQKKSGANCVDSKAVVERHHAMQRMLVQRGVVIPFAEKLADGFRSQRPEARRAFPQLCGMIEASAVLHQFQRSIDDEGRIIATLDDYDVAAKLCRTPFARSLGGQVSAAAIRFHERVTAWSGAAQRIDGTYTPFKVSDAAKFDDKSETAIRGWLKELDRLGAVEQTEKAAGSKGALWALTMMPHSEVQAGGFELPTRAELEGTVVPVAESGDPPAKPTADPVADVADTDDFDPYDFEAVPF